MTNASTEPAVLAYERASAEDDPHLTAFRPRPILWGGVAYAAFGLAGAVGYLIQFTLNPQITRGVPVWNWPLAASVATDAGLLLGCIGALLGRIALPTLRHVARLCLLAAIVSFVASFASNIEQATRPQDRWYDNWRLTVWILESNLNNALALLWLAVMIAALPRPGGSGRPAPTVQTLLWASALMGALSSARHAVPLLYEEGGIRQQLLAITRTTGSILAHSQALTGLVAFVLCFIALRARPSTQRVLVALALVLTLCPAVLQLASSYRQLLRRDLSGALQAGWWLASSMIWVVGIQMPLLVAAFVLWRRTPTMITGPGPIQAVDKG